MIKQFIYFEKHCACSVCNEKMAIEDGHSVFFFFLFLGVENLAKFDSKIAKLVEFTYEKQDFPNAYQFVC